MKYYFRGIIIFEYNPITKQVEIPTYECESGNFNFCNFIPEDYKLIAQFFDMCHKHSIGEIATDDLKDIEVY